MAQLAKLLLEFWKQNFFLQPNSVFFLLTKGDPGKVQPVVCCSIQLLQFVIDNQGVVPLLQGVVVEWKLFLFINQRWSVEDDTTNALFRFKTAIIDGFEQQFTIYRIKWNARKLKTQIDVCSIKLEREKNLPDIIWMKNMREFLQWDVFITRSFPQFIWTRLSKTMKFT